MSGDVIFIVVGAGADVLFSVVLQRSAGWSHSNAGMRWSQQVAIVYDRGWDWWKKTVAVGRYVIVVAAQSSGI